MNLSQIERVTVLKNHRAAAQKLRSASVSGGMSLTLAHGGEELHVFSVISPEGVRRAIAEACADFIIETEEELEKLGVWVEDSEPKCEGTVEQWKRECGIFQTAWKRELGKFIGPKRHLIDALVRGTRDLVEELQAARPVLVAARAWGSARRSLVAVDIGGKGKVELAPEAVRALVEAEQGLVRALAGGKDGG